MNASSAEQTRILVTGGAGFIGSAVMRDYLRSDSHMVVNLDALTYAGNLDSLSEVSTQLGYHFEQVDITERLALESVFARYRPQIVIHLAAESHVDRSIDSPAAFMQTNVHGSFVLLEVALQYWEQLDEQSRQQFRFVHVSTDEVYGDLQPDAPAFTEKSPYQPSSPYAATKAASDHLARAWHRTYGLPVIVTNCSNNYGPYQFPEKFIPHMILRALSGESLPVYGDGGQVRDWLHVEDHARAIRAVVESGCIGRTYNIGASCERRNIDLVETLCEQLEQVAPDRKPASVAQYRDLIEFVTDRPGHDRRYAIDASYLRRELGWQPQRDFETGLRETIRWYIDHEQWWRRVLDGSYRLQRRGIAD